MNNVKTPYDIYAEFQRAGLYIELINGKWFLNKTEYALYGMDGLLNKLMNYSPWMRNPTNARNFVSFMIDVMSDMYSQWPELPILSKAKLLLKEGKLQPPAYPLNTKELMIIHYILEGNDDQTYAIFFHGVGGSGKSTICNLIAKMFGDLDVSYCGFNQVGDKFARETLAGKRLWYDADINPNWSDSATNTLKKIITHDNDQFEKKGKNPYSANYQCKPLFCCNLVPKFDVSDSGILRRIVYYSKNEKIKNPDGSLARKQWTEDDLVNIAAHALNTPIDNFYETFEAETKELIMSSNTVAKYGLNVDYDIYKERCQDAGYHPFAEEKFFLLKELFLGWKGLNNENQKGSKPQILF